MTILLLRAWPRVVYPQLWAEDGQVFLTQVIHSPWTSLVTFYDGYLQLVPRIITFLEFWLVPLKWYAGVNALACFILFAWIASKITESGYAWLIPKFWQRLGVAVFMVLAPGMAEGLGNSANLYTYLFLYLGLLGLKDRTSRYHWFEVFFGVLCAFSTGSGVLLIPLFLYRLGYRYYVNRHYWYESLLLLAIAGHILLAVLLRPPGTEMIVDGMLLLKILIYNFFRSVVLHPLIGDHLLDSLIHYHKAWFWSLSLIASIPLVLTARKRWSTKFIPLGLFFMAMALYPVLIALARNFNRFLMLTYDYGDGVFVWWLSRYSYLLPVIGVLVWMIALSTMLKKWPRLQGVILGVWLVGTVWINKYRMPIAAWGNPGEWGKLVPYLEQAKMNNLPTPMKLPIYPVGWNILLFPGNKNKLIP